MILIVARLGSHLYGYKHYRSLTLITITTQHVTQALFTCIKPDTFKHAHLTQLNITFCYIHRDSNLNRFLSTFTGVD